MSTRREFVNQFRMHQQAIDELEQNLGVQLWLEWLGTSTGMNESEPDNEVEVNRQLKQLASLLEAKGIILAKLVVEFNCRSGSKLGCCGAGTGLYFNSGSPSSVSPRAIFNVIADLYYDNDLYLIRR